MLFQATGESNARNVSLNLTDNEVRFLLTVLRTRQDECRKVTPEYPKNIYEVYHQLDIDIERLKVKVAGQI